MGTHFWSAWSKFMEYLKADPKIFPKIINDFLKTTISLEQP
jgi:hypothetical protein